jgi:tRNA 2-thiouridine synthesizing protein C
MAKSMLIISRQSPWSGPSAREALDIALAGGAFDLPIALLFMDDGVFQLAANQQPRSLQQKDLSANLQALPMFGVEELFACKSSLQARGLLDTTLSLPAEPVESAEISALIERFDQVITI